MSNLNIAKRVKDLYASARRGRAYIPTYHTFAQEQIEGGNGTAPIFQKGQHYFQVKINEMFLAYAREWISEYDPVVFASTKFLYGTETKEVPRVIGPDLLSQRQRQLSDAVRYINTPVSGLHPYAGSDVVLFVALYRVEQDNYLRNLLSIVDKITGIFDFSAALQSYLTTANVILDGLDMILGTNETKPVVAVRRNIGVGDEFKPGYHVLIDAQDGSIDTARLWVRGDRLCIGDSLQASEPYQEHDFVLFSVVQTDEREDESKLPFFPLWHQAVEQAIKPNLWDEAKASFQALLRELWLSPDLTEPQREQLEISFWKKLEQRRDRAKQYAQMGTAQRGAETIPDATTKLRDLDARLKGLD